MGSARLLAVLCCLGVAPSALALDPARALTQLSLRTWSEPQGLPQPTVRDIAQTADGFLWLATDGGLVRFDGNDFRVFDNDAADDEIRALAAEGDGLWVGRRRGEWLQHHRRGQVLSWRAQMAPASLSGVTRIFKAGDGQLWLGGFSGVALLAGGRVQKLTLPRDDNGGVWAFARAPDGAIWLSSRARLWRGNPSAFTPVASPGGPTQTIRALLFDRQGRLWVGADDGLWWWHDHRFVSVSGARVQALLQDRDGAIWIGSSAGLSRWTPAGMASLSRAHGLVDEDILALAEDHDGAIWIGTRSGGLAQLSVGIAAAWTTSDGLPDVHLTAVAPARAGGLWLGTAGEGVLLFDPARQSARRYQPHDGIGVGDVTTLLEDSDGTLWIGGSRGPPANLCRLRQQAITAFGDEQGLPTRERVRALYRDRRGTLWVGADGLYRLVGERFVREAPAAVTFGNVAFLGEDADGNLLAAWSRAAVRGADGWRALPLAPHHTPIFSGLVDQRGAAWLGSARGLMRWSGGALKPLVGDGLPDSRVFCLAEDRGGSFWLSTPAGLYHIRHPERLGSGAELTRFGQADGLKTSRFEGQDSRPACARDATGRLWFITARGLLSVDPGQVERDLPPAPRPVVESLAADGAAVAFGEPARVPAGTRQLQVRFTAPALRGAERLEFAAWLAPVDRRWTPLGRTREARYLQLGPGRYTLRVRAANAVGRWGAPSEALSFVVPTRLHQTWWLQAGLLVTLGAVLWTLHGLRLRAQAARQAAVQAERLRIARDMHDVVAQAFTGVSLQLEAAVTRLGDAAEPAREQLDRARLTARRGLAEARRAVWNLRHQDETPDLPGMLDTLARPFSGALDLRVRVEGRVRPLPEASTDALLRVAQEALTNAIKYAKAKQMELLLRYEEEEVVLEVSDTGNGFDPAAPVPAPGGLGLLGMQERVANAGGSLAIHSAPGEGTTVSARFPAGGAR